MQNATLLMTLTQYIEFLLFCEYFYVWLDSSFSFLFIKSFLLVGERKVGSCCLTGTEFKSGITKKLRRWMLVMDA